MLTASTAHKFYVSTTNIEYVEEKESLQIITKIFIDDMEDVLQKRYNPSLVLAGNDETKADAALVKKYILQKLKIWVDGKPVSFNYIGKKYDVDVVKAFIEVKNVKNPATITVQNEVLMDLFSEQQNIIHLKTPSARHSLLLDKNNPKGMLKFD